ncbi:MAG TPA: glycosyltransferase family 39 protein [Polyangiaceae bacterium]|nr:glycosyltransferase family 39 protein [Polyangiaceae bacterium]
MTEPSKPPESGLPEHGVPERRDRADRSPRHSPAADWETAPTEQPSELEFEEIRLPPGHPLRWSALLCAVGSFVLWTLWLARVGHSRLAVPVGTTFALLTSICVLRGLGCLDASRAPDAICSGRRGLRVLLMVGAGGLGFVGALRVAVAGVLPWPQWSSGVLVTAAALALLAALARVPVTLGLAKPTRLYTQYGPWSLLALGVLLYVPWLGSFSLLDPWETHYGEVAREMLARDDWLSFWWAHERWFFSKPALDFWLQGSAFSLLGVQYQPGEMLASVQHGQLPAPEWAARIPIVVLSLVAVFLSYDAVARYAGRRAAWFSGAVLLTTPYWFLLSRNGMTDMPYAAPVTSALALIALGLATPPHRVQKEIAFQFSRTRWTFTARSALLLLVLCTVFPVLAYLASRNLSWVGLGHGAWPLRVQADHVLYGSGGQNCGLPGNDPCEQQAPQNPLIQPALAALLWLLPLGLFLFANRGEYRVQRLYFIAAWYFTALATLGKGAPGLVLPVAIGVAAVLVARRYERLVQLELVGLLLLVCCVTLPWYVQVYLRHGPEFTNRLLFYDMYQRAFEHVHDTNSGEDVSFRYYIWQLGYGLFPWTSLSFVALACHRASLSAGSRKPAALVHYLGLWALLTFCLFSASLTKFHHYILPAAPAVALITGLVAARAVGRSNERLADWAQAVVVGFGSVAGAWLLSSGARQDAHHRALYLGVSCVCLMLTCGALFARKAAPSAKQAGYASAVFGLAALLGAGWIALVTWDLSNPGSVPGDSRLLHLFSYNYARGFPSNLDFSAEFASFGWVAATLCGLLLVPSLRAVLLRSSLLVACLFCVFVVNVYLPRIAPHFGQRNTLLEYYRARHSADELLVAYQMNWKGENFYSGNRLAIFINTGQRLTSFLAERREAGRSVLFFTAEHSRLSHLQLELGSVKSFRLLTTREQNDKFFLARVEL